jgi:hypothetical protein
MALYTQKGLHSFNTTSAGSGGIAGGTRRELVLDQLSYVSPVETPLMACLDKIPVDGNKRIEWGVDHIARPTAIVADAETASWDHDGTADNTRDKLANYTHIMHSAWAVTRTQRAMNEVGISDEYLHQGMKASLELGMLIELALRYSCGAYSGETSRMHGLFAWALHSSAAAGGGARTIAASAFDSTTYQSSYYCPATAADLTLDQFNDEILEKGWEKGMDLSQSISFVGPKLKKLMSTWGMLYTGAGASLTATPRNTLNLPGRSKRLVDYIDVLETEYGTIYVYKDRWLSSSTTYNLDTGSTLSLGSTQENIDPRTAMIMFEPRYVKMGALYGIEHLELAQDGPTNRAGIYTEVSLVVRNPRAIAGGHNLCKV